MEAGVPATCGQSFVAGIEEWEVSLVHPTAHCQHRKRHLRDTDTRMHREMSGPDASA
jgi:hypothetical protein